MPGLPKAKRYESGGHSSVDSRRRAPSDQRVAAGVSRQLVGPARALGPGTGGVLTRSLSGIRERIEHDRRSDRGELMVR